MIRAMKLRINIPNIGGKFLLALHKIIKQRRIHLTIVDRQKTQVFGWKANLFVLSNGDAGTTKRLNDSESESGSSHFKAETEALLAWVS